MMASDSKSYRNDGVWTKTSHDQLETERLCSLSLIPFDEDLAPEEAEDFQQRGLLNESGEVLLMREKHVAYLKRGLKYLGPGYISLDASRPWLAYWILHSLDLLGEPLNDVVQQTIKTLASCAAKGGGYGGGPGQLAHCAPTYASVLALLLLGSEDAYRSIDRPALYRFFYSIMHASGGFRMHHDGEVDVRGTYTVIAVASMLNMLTPELASGVADYVLSCQTYEGGFGGEPWSEAHGGYAFCAFATLALLGQAKRARLDDLLWWLCNRQMRLEGGFQGRTNKLVDGCYSFWQGGALAVLEYVLRDQTQQITHRDQKTNEISLASEDVSLRGDGLGGVASDAADADVVSAGGAPSPVDHMVEPAIASSGGLAFNQTGLQRYVLACAQQFDGGLRDKPRKPRDYYHTCYNLSGLSVAQHCLSNGAAAVLGSPTNELRPTNPVYNICEARVRGAMTYFARLPRDHAGLLADGASSS